MAGDTEAHTVGISVRVGIHTGTAIRGDVGAGDRRDFTLIGAEVNKAQRIEAGCERGAVYVSDVAAGRARPLMPNVIFEEVAPIHAKGIDDEIKVFRVREM